MAKYRVELARRVYTTIEVEAENQKQAMRKAEKMAAYRMGYLCGGKWEDYKATGSIEAIDTPKRAKRRPLERVDIAEEEMYAKM